MRFFPCEKGKTPAFFKEKPSTKAISPFLRGKNRLSRGVENRGSLISVPLALRVISGRPVGARLFWYPFGCLQPFWRTWYWSAKFSFLPLPFYTRTSLWPTFDALRLRKRCEAQERYRRSGQSGHDEALWPPPPQSQGIVVRAQRLKKIKFQRTPWGGGKRRGVENLMNDTPPKKGFWTPPRTVRFPPPSGVSALFLLYKNPRQSRPEALLEGSKNFRESAFSGTFSSPHTFCTPPYHGPITS